QGNTLHIDSQGAWQKRREELKERILLYLGEAPDLSVPAPQIRIYEEQEHPEYRQLLIGYMVEPDEEVRAHLLIPPPERLKSGAAVLCQHGSNVPAQDTQPAVG